MTAPTRCIKILEYVGLDVRRVRREYDRVVDAIGRGDFRAAQVKKLSKLSHGRFYRAKLGDSDRLLFSLWRYGEDTCALMLEVIENHQYEKSRFLRGAVIDEAQITDADPIVATEEATQLRYLNPRRATIHVLDKPISFDDAQEALLQLPPPAIVVGSAGSGKTALTLEKLKHAEGEALYVTLSAYLARSARDLYYANGFEHSGQEVHFLSFREFVETLRVPRGREAQWRDFAAWFARRGRTFRGIESHQAFEEIRGVIAAGAEGPLSREAYLDLGIRQSIVAAEQRGLVYDLFETYRAWLAEASLYDLNLVAGEWRALAQPRFDFAVIDEVQDLTPVQLALVLGTLKARDRFLLCGDSNQIVHPNFFSWTQVKTLFWRDPILAERQSLQVLTANYRNGLAITRVANTLLKIKHARFGSIDRESNFLVEAVGGMEGTVALMADREAIKRDLDAKTALSNQVAVLVMRDEDKVEARKYFSTPLLFSIHEAKGLEYDNIVLFRFVSDHRREFLEIVDGVAEAALSADTLDYRRARDKTDKSLEIYKFFVNALYVALTRAVSRVYLVESDTGHPLFGLLRLAEGASLAVEARRASREEWQNEARKLELQGKQEQAEAIRNTLLKQAAPPWQVFDEATTRELLTKVFSGAVSGRKTRQQLQAVIQCQDEPVLTRRLQQQTGSATSAPASVPPAGLDRKLNSGYFSANFRDVLTDCDRYGIDHRLPMNVTPLMAAAATGNIPLIEALLRRGADPEAVDHFGRNALHWAMLQAFSNTEMARRSFAGIYELLAPASVDVNTGDRLVRIDRHLSEYFLFQTLWVLFKSRFTRATRTLEAAFDTQAILDAWENMPANAVRPDRKRRQFLSGLLSRNEIDRDYAYNRKLFRRLRQGWYQFSPQLSVRRHRGGEEVWVPILVALNLPFVKEGAIQYLWRSADELLAASGLPPAPNPIAGPDLGGWGEYF